MQRLSVQPQRRVLFEGLPVHFPHPLCDASIAQSLDGFDQCRLFFRSEPEEYSLLPFVTTAVPPLRFLPDRGFQRVEGDCRSLFNLRGLDLCRVFIVQRAFRPFAAGDVQVQLRLVVQVRRQAFECVTHRCHSFPRREGNAVYDEAHANLSHVRHRLGKCCSAHFLLGKQYLDSVVYRK